MLDRQEAFTEFQAKPESIRSEREVDRPDRRTDDKHRAQFAHMKQNATLSGMWLFLPATGKMTQTTPPAGAQSAANGDFRQGQPLLQNISNVDGKVVNGNNSPTRTMSVQ